MNKGSGKKTGYMQSIGAKVAAGFALMVLVIAVSGALGWINANRLGEMLTHVSDEVFATNDTSMGTQNANSDEDKYIALITSEVDDTAHRNELMETRKRTEAGLAKLRELKTLPAEDIAKLDAGRKTNLDEMEKFLAMDAAFKKQYQEFCVHFQDLLAVLHPIEEKGDATWEAFEATPDKSFTWNTGIAQLWHGSDGVMNILIRLYQQSYFFEKILSGQDRKTCIAQIERGTGELDEAVAEFLTSDLGAAKIEEGPHAGQKVGATVKPLIAEHQEMLKDIIAKHDELMTEKEVYWKSGVALDGALTAANEAADKMAREARESAQSLRRTVTLSLVTALTVGILIAVACAVFMVRLILKPIGAVVTRLQDIAEGEGDLTRRMNLERADELGTLAFWFDTFVEKIHKTVKSVAECTHTLSAASEQTASTSSSMSTNAEGMTHQSTSAAAATEQASAGIRNVAAAIEEISANSNTVANEAGHVSQNLVTVGQAVEEVSGNMNSIASAVEEMSASLNSIASSVEEMSASLKGVSSNTTEAAQLAESASHKASTTAETVNRLGSSAKAIDKVIDLITGIAEQTNLLALNATIEAASAGEAGKGFAVVANEVKELAKQTGRATQEIRQQVEEMQSNTGEAVSAIGDIVQVIGRVNETFRVIASAVQEQSLTINEVVRNVSDAAKGGQEVSHNVQSAARSSSGVAQNVQDAISSVNSIARSVNELATGANEIARNAAEASTGMNQVAQNVQNVNSAAQVTQGGAQELNSAARDLAGLAGQLQQLVGSFAV